MITSQIFSLVIIVISIAGIVKVKWQDKLAFIPYRIKHYGEWYRFFTCSLVHANIFHLLVNVYVLQFFGRFVELDYAKYFGSDWEGIALIALFLTGSAASVIMTYRKFKNDPKYIAVGASGAVSAIVFTVFVYRTFTQIDIAGYRVPLMALSILFLLITALATFGKKSDVNHDAHLYGALYGVLINLIINPRLIESFWYGIKNLIG